MGPGSVVIIEILGQRSFQMFRIQNDEVVQALSSDRANQALGVRILPGTLRRSQHLFDPECRDPLTNIVSVDAVPISDQISGWITIGEGFYNLL